MSLCHVHLAEEEHEGGLGRHDPPVRVVHDPAQEGWEVLANHKHVAESKGGQHLVEQFVVNFVSDW